MLAVFISTSKTKRKTKNKNLHQMQVHSHHMQDLHLVQVCFRLVQVFFKIKHYICIMNNKNICDMKVGDNVLISPDLTHQTDWVKGKIIDVEQNQFVGVVISAETSDGDIFFGYEDLFKAAEVCMH